MIRRPEHAAAWVLVVLACCAGLLGLVGPLLGGEDPGLRGPIGFASETVAALWLPGGMLAAFVAVAVLVRRLWWPAAALAPVALVILIPELWGRSWPLAARLPELGPVLRVATVNLNHDNDEDPLMEESLRRIDADVLVLPEFTSAWAERLESWFAGDYPHRWLAALTTHPGYYFEGLRLAVWSRLAPAGKHEVRHLGRFLSQIRVPLRWRGRAFALFGIHPRKPFPYVHYAGAWRDRQELLDWIRGERLPAVVAGDFNASPRSAFLRRLRLLGLTNASEAVHGHAPATWHMRRPAPLRIAIDHVMLSDAFTAVGFELGPTTNSDHAPVVAELTWRQR